MAAVKFDAYQVITDKIIAAMEAGVAPWTRDWKGEGNGLAMPLRSNGANYQGVNVLILWIAAMTKGYKSNRWFTFKQAQEFGGMVRKGEKGEQVCYFQMIEKESKTGGEKDKFPMLKLFTVFNAEQIDNLPEKFETIVDEVSVVDGPKSIDYMETFVQSTGARIVFTGSQPCYVPALDHIEMPTVAQFSSAESYYGTLCHELIHWTGHSTRLDRLNGKSKTDYAFEELVAELGACFVTNSLGIDKGIDRSAAYIGSWLKALKDDKKYIFQAASQAQAATNVLLKK